MTQTDLVSFNSVKQSGKWRIPFTGAVVASICGFGLYESIHATGVLARGGSGIFGGLFDYPAWAAAHFAGAAAFVALVPLQLLTRIRTRTPRLHRLCGRLAAAAAVVLAISGAALPYAMPARPTAERISMTSFAMTFLFFLARAVAAARRRDVNRHREWMIRLIAIGLSPMTQRLIFPMFAVAFGISSMADFWLYFVIAAWLAAAIHIVFGEWVVTWTRGSHIRSPDRGGYATGSFISSQSGRAVAPIDS